jgi:hypothetical protein
MKINKASLEFELVLFVSAASGENILFVHQSFQNQKNSRFHVLIFRWVGKATLRALTVSLMAISFRTSSKLYFNSF